MRVAHISDCYLPRLGGIEVQVHDLARHLMGAGHEVEVFSGQPYPILDERVPLVKLPSLDIYNDYFPMRMPGVWELKSWMDFAEVFSFMSGTFPEPLAFSLRAWDHLRQRPGQFCHARSGSSSHADAARACLQPANASAGRDDNGGCSSSRDRASSASRGRRWPGDCLHAGENGAERRGEQPWWFRGQGSLRCHRR